MSVSGYASAAGSCDNGAAAGGGGGAGGSQNHGRGIRQLHSDPHQGIFTDLWGIINGYASEACSSAIPPHFTDNISDLLQSGALPHDLIAGRSDVASDLLRRACGNIDRLFPQPPLTAAATAAAATDTYAAGAAAAAPVDRVIPQKPLAATTATSFAAGAAAAAVVDTLDAAAAIAPVRISARLEVWRNHRDYNNENQLKATRNTEKRRSMLSVETVEMALRTLFLRLGISRDEGRGAAAEDRDAEVGDSVGHMQRATDRSENAPENRPITLSQEAFLALKGSVSHLILDAAYCELGQIRKILNCFNAVTSVTIENKLAIMPEERQEFIRQGIAEEDEEEGFGLTFTYEAIADALQEFAGRRTIRRLHICDIARSSMNSAFMEQIAKIASLESFALTLSYAREMELRSGRGIIVGDEEIPGTGTKFMRTECKDLSNLSSLNLKELHLGASYEVTTPSLSVLIREAGALLQRLTVLSFDYSAARLSGYITDAYLEQLTPHCPNVEQLNLAGHPQITDAGLVHLEKLTNLKVLHLTHCSKLSIAAIGRLMERLPALGKVVAPDGSTLLKHS